MNAGAFGRLAGKGVLITGAAQGIGAAVALACAEAGASVLLTDVSAEVTNTAVDIAQTAGNAAVRALVMDAADRDAWAAVMADLSAHGMAIDGLVNNAGINVKHAPLEMPDGDWDRCLDTNLKGAWLGSQAVLPKMISRGAGAIVNIASVHAHQIIPGSFPYPVAKAGLIGLTRALGVEYAAAGVRVNAISPGYVDTVLVRDWWAAQPDPAAAQLATLGLIPSGRVALPREVAMACVFLLSDECPSINATVLAIDGASLARLHP